MLLTIVGPIRRTAILIAPSPAAVLSIRALAGKPHARSQQPLQLAARLQFIDAPSLAITCWRNRSPRGGSTAASKCGILAAVAVTP
jgi:hypothetical protein